MWMLSGDNKSFSQTSCGLHASSFLKYRIRGVGGIHWEVHLHQAITFWTKSHLSFHWDPVGEYNCSFFYTHSWIMFKLLSEECKELH